MATRHVIEIVTKQAGCKMEIIRKRENGAMKERQRRTGKGQKGAEREREERRKEWG